MFIDTPNLPNNKIKTALVDYRAEDAIAALEKLGIRVYTTPKTNIAYPAVSGHPDMLFHHISATEAIVAPEVFEYFSRLFPHIKIISGKNKIGGTYPADVAYNVARINKRAFLNVKYTDERILEYYKENCIELINVKQGYSKCSICIVSENAIITSDKKIALRSTEYGFDALCIREGYVKLKDFSYGFIGGASGLISGEILAFNGNIKKHPDYSDIKSFCRNHGVDVYSLHNKELEDIGSVIPCS